MNRSVGVAVVVVDWVSAAPVGAAVGDGARSVPIGSAGGGGARSEQIGAWTGAAVVNGTAAANRVTGHKNQEAKVKFQRASNLIVVP
ncbi:hypothetical protein E3N88_35857 [Mikania micrantha]|uniref:Secreted protein n=1 Tax=Mikania micrantha TaxID=192012 RepID=A0A5N6M279_9ASTR|nr:hypothetical protein E3N88_35857 [Mikania micrantha]